MNHIRASSANELQIALSRQLMESGVSADPRGMRTLELLGLSFELANPRNRLTTLPSRKWSPALAIAELAWHVRGDEDVGPLAFYTPRWREFADENGIVRGSCYGARIFKASDGGSAQWVNVRRLLKADPSSRRAVLNFRVNEDVSRESNDVSCTNTLQFILRDEKLHAFVSMRSNDAIWGVPYDLFLFTSFQELMALELGVEIGSYHHYAASMHVYERHFKVARSMADDVAANEGGMPPMTSWESVRMIVEEEAHLRLQGRPSGAKLDAYAARSLDLLENHRAFSQAA